MSRLLAGTNSTTTPPPPPLTNSDNDFVVILAAFLCALICVLGLIAVARCNWIRRISGEIIISGADHSLPAAANKGLKKNVLKQLPKFTYSPESIADKVSDCAICLSEFAAGDEIRVLPRCGHGFHVTCIDTWLGAHSTCPSCRQILVPASCKKCGELTGSRIPAAGEASGSVNRFLP